MNIRVSLLAGAAGVAYVLQATPGWPTWAAWIALGVGALLTIATVTVNILDNKRRAKRFADAEELAKQARLEAMEATRSAIEPGLDALVRIAAEGSRVQRRAMAGRLKQLIVGIACEIKPGARASYFQYDDSGPARLLQWERIWKPGANRHDPPRPEFVEGDQGPGDEILRMMDEGRPFFIEDVRKQPPRLRREPRDYETYIAAPVVMNGKKFGFLGVDAPLPGDLGHEDVNTMRILAMILAVGLSIAA